MATAKKKKSALQDMVGTVATAIVIMIVLTIFVFPMLRGKKGGKLIGEQIESIAVALDEFRSENGNLPIGTQREIATALKMTELEKDGRLLDPWETPYQIYTSNDGYVIRSAGHNKEFDSGRGEGDGDDIYFGSR